MKKRISAMLLITAMLLCMMAFADQGSVYAESQIPVVEKASLELNKPTEICVNANEDSGPYYAAYSFKTSNMKSYYGVTVEKAEGVNWDPSWYLVTDTKDREGTKVVWGVQLGKWADFGSALGNNQMLRVNTTYYLCIDSHQSSDFKATITIKENMDGEGDTAELSDPVIPNVTKYGALEDRADVDVFELEGKSDYVLSMKSEKKIDFTVYSDAALSSRVYHEADNEIKSKDLSTKMSAGSKYYVVIKYSGESSSDPKGEPIGYEITFKSASTNSGGGGGNGGTDIGGGSGNGNTETGGGGTENGGSGNGSADTGSYQETLKTSKAMITNMTSSNTYKIKGKKLVIKRGKGGYLFQKSKIKHGVFTKSKNLRKKTYKFKLAKNYRIVYGAKEDGSRDSKKTKTWFNKAYKNKKSSTRANVNLFLNKKNEIVLIYISSWDIGAEQTD